MSTEDTNDYGAAYGAAFTDYQGDETGPAYPWLQLSPAGFFYADLRGVADIGSAAHWLDLCGAKERTEEGRDVLALEQLVFNLVARRRRFLVADPRDGKTLAIRGDYDSAKVEAERRRAKVRGHVQLLGLATAPKGSAAEAAGPFAVMLTAKGVQSSHLWGIERLTYERCVRPVEQDGTKGIPPLAYSILLGFGPAAKVGDFGFELAPMLVKSPANVLTADKARGLIRLPPATTRKLYNDSRPWLAAWARFDASADPKGYGGHAGKGRDAAPPADRSARDERSTGRNGSAADVGDDEIPF